MLLDKSGQVSTGNLSHSDKQTLSVHAAGSQAIYRLHAAKATSCTGTNKCPDKQWHPCGKAA